jgi:anti-sigma factor RsiW
MPAEKEMKDDCQPVRELLSAYLDNELSVSESLTLERHVHDCADCADELAQLTALSGAVKKHAVYHPVSALVAERVARLSSAPERLRLREWLARLGGWKLAGALATTIFLIGNLAWYFSNGEYENRLADELVASHVRSLLSHRPSDVASSERHVVKPWFGGKLDFSPPVNDFSLQGFPLLGGRLDFVAKRTVGVIVYGRRQHIINLYVWPSAAPSDAAPRSLTQNGYNLVEWQRDGMQLWFVSDLGLGELVEFTGLFQEVLKNAPTA